MCISTAPVRAYARAMLCPVLCRAMSGTEPACGTAMCTRGRGGILLRLFGGRAERGQIPLADWHGHRGRIRLARAPGQDKTGTGACYAGYYEKDDLSTVVDYLKSHERVTRIGLWGHSMGACTCLLYAASGGDQ
eukprot:2254503-Rhodomonas_salina.4